MAEVRVKFTRKVVEGATPGRTSRFLWDSEVIGLGLRLTPAGSRAYVLQYRFGGRPRRYTIGAHASPWTPETARERARLLLGQVAGGVDPQEERGAERRAMTLAQLCDLYLTEGLATRKPTSIASARGNIENHIKPLLGAKRAALVTRQDVERLMIAVANGQTARRAKTRKKRGLSRVRGGRGAANATIVTLSAALAFGVSRKVRDDNPAWRLRRFPEKKLERFLSPAELGRLGEAIAAAEALGVESPYALAALRLLILTGCRKNEILSAKHAYVDRWHRCLRLPDSKTGAKVVHLGAAALKVVEGLEPLGDNPYLLPGKGGEGHLINLQKPWERIRAAAGLDDVRIHDLRHSFASLGVASGDSLFVVGALLGHRSSKTTQRYAHLADSPVKNAAERISREVALLIGGDEADLLPPEPAGATEAPVPARAASVLGEVRRTRWLDTPQAAAVLGNTVGTLQTWRWMGVGPIFRKIGRRVVYAEADLVAWREREGGPAPSPVASPAGAAEIPSDATNVVRLSDRRGTSDRRSA
jgi:integrase